MNRHSQSKKLKNKMDKKKAKTKLQEILRDCIDKHSKGDWKQTGPRVANEIFKSLLRISLGILDELTEEELD